MRKFRVTAAHITHTCRFSNMCDRDCEFVRAFLSWVSSKIQPLVSMDRVKGQCIQSQLLSRVLFGFEETRKAQAPNQSVGRIFQVRGSWLVYITAGKRFSDGNAIFSMSHSSRRPVITWSLRPFRYCGRINWSKPRRVSGSVDELNSRPCGSLI